MKAHVRLRGRRWYAVIEAPKDAGGNRKRKWRRLPAGLKGKKEAETEAAKLVVKMSSATYLEPSKTTLAVYLDRWLDHMRSQVSPRTRENYGEVVTILNPLLGNVPLLKLKPAEIAKAWSDALRSGRKDRKGGLSTRSVQLMHRVLSQALKQAIKWELLESNPAAAVKPPRVERKQMKVLDAEQTAALIKFARGRPRMFMPVLLSALCGLRRGEVAALKWQAIDLDAAQMAVTITLEQTADGLREKPPKSGKARTVALPAIVVEELRRHRIKQAEELLRLGIRQTDVINVCLREDASIWPPQVMTTAFRRFIKASGLPHIRLHDLRHTHATHLLTNKIHPKVVQERLGHATISMTMDLYSHVMPGMQQEAAASIDATLRSAMKKQDSR